MAKDDLLAKYATHLASRLRLQQRSTIIVDEKVVHVVVFAAEALDVVAAKLDELAGAKQPRGARKQR